MTVQKTKEEEALEEKMRHFKKTVRDAMKLSEKRNSRPSGSGTLMNYNTDDIEKWMTNPVTYESQLRDLSRYFYNVSALYRQIVRYMALMPAYAYTIVPHTYPVGAKKEEMKIKFMETAKYIDKLNLRYEMIKALLVAFREDTFYGYEHETEDSYFIQTLNGKYCRISSVEDGALNFAYDFGYFDSFQDELVLFPKEFQKKYKIYKNKGADYKWQELDSSKTVCLKVNIDILDYSIPPFASMLQAITDLDDYKEIKKDGAKNNNFMAFIQRIPIDDKAGDINKFLIDLDTAMIFHQMADETLPDGVGVITSPMPIEAVKTEKNRSDNDVVSEAYREAYRDAGVSEFLFNSDKNTSIGLAKSIMVDEETVFTMFRQIEVWINRKLKNRPGKYKYKFNLLDITVFNRDEKHKKYLESAQYGIPVIMEIGATLGLSPHDFMNKVTLEADVLDLHTILKPLQSSFNKLEDNTGRPSQGDNISDSGQKNKDADTDAKKKG